MTNTIPVQVVCPDCGAVNRVPSNKLREAPLCGKCRSKLIAGGPIVANDQNFSRIIEKTGLPVVVDFWAPWCAPCRQFAPVLEQVAAEMATQVSFIKLDTQANPQTAARHQIRSIPTLMMFHQGREVARVSGALPKARFQQWLNQQLSGLNH
ncbi:MAG: thioredoxin TrxC [Arenicellales bacterium]